MKALKGLSHIRVRRLKNEDFSRNPMVVEPMNRDPLIASEKLDGQDGCRVAAKANGSRFFKESAGCADKTLKLYEGAFHDLLNDLGKEAVARDILNWRRVWQRDSMASIAYSISQSDGRSDEAVNWRCRQCLHTIRLPVAQFFKWERQLISMRCVFSLYRALMQI
jgi:hypothetical protein